MHIARAGFKLGDYPVVYNFMRAFKAHVAEFKPDRVLFVTEGSPTHKKALFSEYKANRIIAETETKKLAERAAFNRQKDLIIDLLKTSFPVSVMQHLDYEADDTIANMVTLASQVTDWTLISTDTDFIQLLQTCKNLRLYNPVKKAFVEPPLYDYVTWKSLRGDGSDNIPGLSGIGDKTAEKYSSFNEAALRSTLSSSDYELFERNKSLIEFPKWTDEIRMSTQTWQGQLDLDKIKSFFEECGFASLTKDKYWNSFSETFKTLA